MSDVYSAENPSGIPRPVLKFNDRMTPVPWIGGRHPFHGDWAMICKNRSKQATKETLCIVCGKKLNSNKWYSTSDCNTFDRPEKVGFEFILAYPTSPAPTYSHPKCSIWAALFCPFLKRQEFPIKTSDGYFLTVDEAREVVTNNGQLPEHIMSKMKERTQYIKEKYDPCHIGKDD